MFVDFIEALAKFVAAISEAHAEIIAGIIAAIVSIVVAIISNRQFKRKMRLDVIIKRRQKSVDERRQTLRELYYYTDSNLIKLLTSDISEEHILKLLEIKSRFDYRLMDMFYPGSEFQELVDELVDNTICIIEKKIDRNVTDNLNVIKEKDYDEKRNECLKKIKLYNYITWEFLQKQSFGQSKKGVKAFYKSYKKTLKSIIKCNNKYKNLPKMTDKIISAAELNSEKRDWIEMNL